MKKHVWIIEAKTHNGKWEPMCYPVLGRPIVSTSRDWLRKQIKFIFNASEYNQDFVKGLSKYPACRYRVAKYVKV